jgi:acyl homoserine lactone synthase
MKESRLIECFTAETAHLFGEVLVSQYRLRHKAFAERQQYQTFTLRGMEYDRYDAPASTYWLARSWSPWRTSSESADRQASMRV